MVQRKAAFCAEISSNRVIITAASIKADREDDQAETTQRGDSANEKAGFQRREDLANEKAGFQTRG